MPEHHLAPSRFPIKPSPPPTPGSITDNPAAPFCPFPLGISPSPAKHIWPCRRPTFLLPLPSPTSLSQLCGDFCNLHRGPRLVCCGLIDYKFNVPKPRKPSLCKLRTSLPNSDHKRRSSHTSATMGPKTRSCGRYYLRSSKLESQQVAARVVHHASMQEPPTSNEKRRLEELRAQGPVLGNAEGLPIDVDDKDVSLQSGRPSPRREREGPSMQIPPEISNCLFAIARSSAARTKLDEVLYGTRRRGKGETSSESVGSESDGSESDGNFERHSRCVRLLEGITPPLPSEQFNLAWEQLLDKAVQIVFLAMPETRRTEWVWSLH